MFILWFSVTIFINESALTAEPKSKESNFFCCFHWKWVNCVKNFVEKTDRTLNKFHRKWDKPNSTKMSITQWCYTIITRLFLFEFREGERKETMNFITLAHDVIDDCGLRCLHVQFLRTCKAPLSRNAGNRSSKTALKSWEFYVIHKENGTEHAVKTVFRNGKLYRCSTCVYNAHKW